MVSGGRVAMLVGPAGIGKSTTLARWGRGSEHVVAKCLPAFSTMAYRPLSHALGQPLHGSDEDVAADVVAALGGRSLAVEDVHWADPSTLQILLGLIGRVPMVVTSRVSGLLGDHPQVDEIVIPPLDDGEAAELARKLHPELTDAERGALLGVSSGNPLLIEHLARDGDVSTSVRDAIAARIAVLPATVVDDLGRLALLDGAPAPSDLIEPERVHATGLTVDVGDGWTQFTHELVAAAVLDALDDDRLRRLRRGLVSRLPPAAACRHHLALGEREEAARAAGRAALDADVTERADLLEMAVDALGADAPDRLLLDAAAAAIDANRPDIALRCVESVRGSGAVRGEAELHRARAAWFAGEAIAAAAIVDAALELVGPVDPRIESQLLVERAFIAVRQRVGDPTIVGVADAAVESATRAGTALARALNTAGLARSHTGSPGWAELFDAAHRAAVDESDDEEQLASRYWLLSALGFYGPMPDAQALGAEMVEETSRRGARRWYHHFLGAHVLHLSGRGDMPDARLAEAHQMLREAPRFRNRAQVELALIAAHLDRDEHDECDRILTAGRAAARSGEDVGLLACAQCEIALARRDVVGMADALATIGGPGVGFFGTNALAESAAIHLAFGRPGEVDPPAVVTTLTPVLDVVRLERDALDRQLAGDVEGAIRSCRLAADDWAERHMHRFARRARLAPVEIALTAGELDLADRLLSAVPAAPSDVSGRRRRDLAAEIARRRARARVTERELEILLLVGSGMTSRQIAERLGIGVSTVDSHVDAALAPARRAHTTARGLARGG